MKVLYIWIAIIIFPFIIMLFRTFELVGLFIENIYYLPISWFDEPFFIYINDIGAYRATSIGRIFGVVVYSIIYWLIYFMIIKFKNKN